MAAFTYMGTKKRLAEKISLCCDKLPAGPFLDLFSGISAAGMAVAPKRQVWCNDVQHFSRTLTEAFYLSTEEGPRVEIIVCAVQHLGNLNLNALVGRARQQVDDECRLIFERTASEQIALQSQLQTTAAEWRSAGYWRADQCHCLFTMLYAGSYLGLVQSIQIDSIRFGADQALATGIISVEEHRWALLALCRALAATSNSTGHFAQYLTANSANIDRVVGKRRRCAWSYWIDALAEMRPLRDAQWRSYNQVFQGDAIHVLQKLRTLNSVPGIIYADPPYTSDQYSRYYHLFETVLLYDYPKVSSKGLYRDDRFQSKFSLVREVAESFRKMIEEAAATGASMMISYPCNGLLPNALQQIPVMMATHFKHVHEPIVIPYQHSTMGASKGNNKEHVDECIFLATN